MARSAGTPAQSHRALVIGANGVLGRVLVEQLTQGGWDVQRGTRDPDAPPGSIRVNLNEPGTVAVAIREVGLVINTAPDLKLTAERMVLESGGLLINVSAMPSSAAQELRDQPGPFRGTVMMNAGVAPGLTNLVAADLINRYPSADQIDLVFTVSAKSPVGEAGSEFAYRGLTSVNRHKTIKVTLPPPYRRRRCIGFAETERAWLGEIAGGRTVNTFICFTERPANFLMLVMNQAGLIRRAAAAIVKAAPSRSGTSEPGREPIAHRISLSLHGQPLVAATLRAQGDYSAAAVATACIARALLTDPTKRRPGVFDPDQLLEWTDVEGDLRRSGVTLDVDDKATQYLARTE